ncbi:oxidoreductase [Perkinsus sp. BL_2016]|nr:oxidoreductase [Perkinsus sp. BL_2016]
MHSPRRVCFENMTSPLPSIFLNHGGGPLPLLGDSLHMNLVKHLTGISGTITKPRVILLASAHWETKEPTFVSSSEPGLLYDYYGFSAESYRIQYPAKNSLQVVERARSLLEAGGLKTHVAPKRGYDHGVFVPLKLMYPDAGIPVVQVSLPISRDPILVYRMGQLLSPLRGEGVLILGSGLSYHNLQSFFSVDSSKSSRSKQFDTALKSACLSKENRQGSLCEWENFPHARYCHPTEEHLMPLLFVAGAADREPCRVIYEDELMGAKISGFQFGRATM